MTRGALVALLAATATASYLCRVNVSVVGGLLGPGIDPEPKTA